MSARTFARGYEVSADGRVFSVRSNWRGKGSFEIVPTLNSHGYLRVRLSLPLGRVSRFVHKIVAAAFLGPRPSPQHEIRHLDGNKKNNSAVNLAWGTRKENAADREAHGRTSRGAAHSAAVRAGIPNPDARLITAAPDLLAALEKLRQHDSAGGPCDVPGLKCDCVAVADAAIAKAGGK